MSKTISVASWLWCSLLPATLLAFSGRPLPADRPLPDLLEEMGERYQVFFTYDADLLGDTQVNFEFKEGEQLETAIDRLLRYTNFRYESFGEKYFVIYREGDRDERMTKKLKKKIRQIEQLEKRSGLNLQRKQSDPENQLGLMIESLADQKEKIDLQGTVHSSTGEPLFGVNIRLLNEPSGTITGPDGAFTLHLPPYASLEFSYVGFKPQVISLDGRTTTLAVNLQPDQLALQEVVVLGYGTTQRGDQTGVAQTVQEEAFRKGANVSPEQLLNGRVAGLQVLSGNGEPGGQMSVRIRGGGSLNASNEPLYVIDGVPIDNRPHNPSGFQSGRNPLNALNPNDIESISVLKDASATAIYGSRGANGVLLITTKKGSIGGRDQITYDAWLSMATNDRRVEVLSPEEFRHTVQDKAPRRFPELGISDTDWQDEIFRKAYGQNHTLGVSGGGKDMGYRASLGYLRQDGVVQSAFTERYSLSLSYHQQFLQDQLKLEANFKGAKTRDRFAIQSTIGNAINFDPTQSVHDEASIWGGYFEYAMDQAIKNPVAELDLTRDLSDNYRSIGNIQLEYRYPSIPSLSVKTNLGYDLATGERKRYLPKALRNQYSSQGEIRIANFFRASLLWESYLHFRKDLANIDTRIDATAGYSYQDFQSEYPEIRAWELNNDVLGFNGTSFAGEFFGSNSTLQNRLISFFGRVNLQWREKYLMTVTVRRDGSSRFSPDNRWGTFPSVALAWKIGEESFLHGISPWVQNLKLRFSAGITGNQEIGDYQYLKTYQFGDSQVRYQFGDQFVTTVRPGGSDPGLKWEETASLNVGLSFDLWQGRVRGELDYYYRRTNDLLSRVIVPAGVNLTDIILTNIGSLNNEGLELGLDARLLRRKYFQWDVSANLSVNHSRISRLTNFSDPRFQGFSTGEISGGAGNRIQILRVGQPANAFFVFRHKRDENGLPLSDQFDHNEDGRINLADIYEDTNGDGIVNDNDKVPYGKPAPDLLFGFSSDWQFGQWDISCTWRGQLGNYVYNNIQSVGGNYDRIITNIVPTNLTRSVQETGFLHPQYFSDYYVEDASFIRLDQVSVGYTFTGLSRLGYLRLYAMANNLLVLTGYSGLDPEIGNASGNEDYPKYGIDDNVFPRARTFMIGVKLII
ncbi:SusC/RagA family TonB-linked outer membrane protein [Flavilitoribacter nigricans]|uniref:SusC/RagA family TonB-linked outer membrane protein n=1 Tax=Flavilitoribacter nigricans TaxID=70997 RepID=UPI0014746D7F|nr:SusC/RagA family TonB-linked outer membrane protein [Flavilitoribacter nigricans]